MSERDMHDRLVRLETLFTHLEDQYEQLNQVVVEQGRTVERLRTQAEKLAGALQAMRRDELGGDSRKPPHYQ